ncbi:MAG TPA: hypothetical protein VKL99_09470 [Candidatus Angelobacter sp.]|nr:hypothetical protein [Candidatus Angelobacter sp.]
MNLQRSVVAVVLACLGSMTAGAQVPQNRFVEYSAKFLCGVVQIGPAGTSSSDPRVRPGVYATSINIHNPQLPNFPGVSFVKKVVLSSPEGKDLIPPSPFHKDVLKPDFAEEVDCTIIRAMSGSTAPFIEGFVVLISHPLNFLPPLNELDVVGVYTVTAPPGPEQSISLEIVPVTPRFIDMPTKAAADKLTQQLLEGVKKEE